MKKYVLCVDKRQVNQVIIRESLLEILQNLNRCSVFSRLAFKFAFHQRELSEQSEELHLLRTEAFLGISPFCSMLAVHPRCTSELYLKLF